MARKGRQIARRVSTDAKFGDITVSKFISSLMWNGKRTVSESIFYGALETISKRFNKEGYKVFQEAMENVRPTVEVRSRRVGGATYQVPTEVRPERRNTLAIRWIIQNARGRGEKSMTERLAQELHEASLNRGNAVKKREETHKMAEANRAFAHYRW
jgi:small subunit ribosomal protein S7